MVRVEHRPNGPCVASERDRVIEAVTTQTVRDAKPITDP